MPQVEQQIIDQLESLLLLDDTPKCRNKRNAGRMSAHSNSPISMFEESNNADRMATLEDYERIRKSEYKERLGLASSVPAVGLVVLGSLTLVLLGAALGRIEPTSQPVQDFKATPEIVRDLTFTAPAAPSSSFAKIPGLFAEKSTITGVVDTKTMTAV